MGAVCKCCKQFAAEFDKERMDFDDFNKGRWRTVFGSSSNRYMIDKRYYTGFRLFESLFMTFITIWSIVDTANEGTLGCWLIYLTHWGLLLETAYFWFATWTCWQACQMESGAKEKVDAMPWYASVTWFLQDLVIPGSFLIFVLYFALVVPTMSTAPGVISYFTHGVDFVLIIVDIFLSRQPYYLIHGIYFMIFGLTYLMWSCIHYLSGATNCKGERYIYKALDWSATDKTLTLGAMLLFVFTPILNLVFWFIISQCFPKNYQSDTTGTV